MNFENTIEVMGWCSVNIGDIRKTWWVGWDKLNFCAVFSFRNEQDAAFFFLKWL
jgi:hypothetical protein